MRCVLILLLLAQPLAAQTLSVTRKMRLWPDGHGKIEITGQAIVYKAEKEKDSRTWNYPDIKYFDRIGPKEFTVLSYEDSRLMLGRDCEYHFVVTEGELTDELFRRIENSLGRPVTNRVVGEASLVRYEIPVKHLHTFGGCEGTLRFTEDSIDFRSDDAKDSREWRLGRDVQSVLSADPYRMDIVVYDNNRREFSTSRVFRFELKARLDPEFYRTLKLRLYDLDTTHLSLR